VSVVTLSRRFCDGCGAPLDHRRRQARTCSSACRKRVSRFRKCDTPRREIADLRREWFGLTFEEREEKRQEIDRRRREQIESREPEQATRDRTLFANDPGRVQR
jgi:hypothetical protein